MPVVVSADIATSGIENLGKQINKFLTSDNGLNISSYLMDSESSLSCARKCSWTLFSVT